MKNELLEFEARKIISRTNHGNYHWTTKQDSYYFDENTLFVAFTKFYDDGVNEKRTSLLYLLTPAFKKELYHKKFYDERNSFDNLDLLIFKIISVEKENENFKVKIRTVSGKERDLKFDI